MGWWLFSKEKSQTSRREIGKAWYGAADNLMTILADGFISSLHLVLPRLQTRVTRRRGGRTPIHVVLRCNDGVHLQTDP